MESFLNGLRRFGIGRLAAVIGAAAGAAAILVAMMMNLGGQPKALLYSNLDLKEASEITSALDQAGVKYEAKGDGSTIMVDRDNVASTRLMLSSKGLPTSGSVGYELFDNASIMGQTEFTQNLNKQRALEGELARTIRSLQGVTSARVHLVLPKRELFEEEAAQPTASIVVGLGGRELKADQVRSLRNLVAGAVPGLKPDHVTVVDESGEMLAAGAEGDEGGYLGELAAGRKAETEERIRRAVKGIVEGVVGQGKARVEVTADLDLNRVTTQEERFDPDGQVVRSTRTAESNQSETDPGADGQVTAAANLPQGQQQPGFLSTSSSSGQTEEITNYEISKTTRTEVVEPGAVKRLSVAVAVDGVTAAGANGKPGAYTARTAAEMQQIEQLVRSAVGYDQERGDQISVVNVRFTRPSAAELGGTAAGAPMLDFDKNDIMRAAEMGILAVVAALIIFFVVRPMLKTAEGPTPGATIPVTHLQPAGAPAGALSYEPAQAALTGPSEMDHRIDIARIEGQVKASSVKKVSEFVGKHPEESASILRNWLHES
ncbi:flagellar basal-body MS-ring/collar protein FliF [Caulobacter sp. 17J80-11]|uniref:flagellar basal-body MS-ring/collar protein FliF n=1 Tax=Caulobacter sp. 17J80-11 TaxID=2763502 RepID=UPI001653798D|nr:flagellar M-ring protein FliF [Caulobacter sp. 17J80-11]